MFSLDEALRDMYMLLNPGRYGVRDDDGKVRLIEDLAPIAESCGVKPVVIGGLAVIVHGYRRTTADVDVLVLRADAMKLIRAVEASSSFSKIRLERFRHNATGVTVDICVEGELTSPHHLDRFPSPADVEQLPRDPLPIVGRRDLLVLKAKSARPQDYADFIQIFKAASLAAADIEAVKAKLTDPRLRDKVDEWHRAALEDIERDRLRKPLRLD